MAKAVLELLDCPKLISHKLWVTEKFCNFYTVIDILSDFVKPILKPSLDHKSLPKQSTNIYLSFLLQKLPSLRSFCMFCAIGIFAVFIFQATLFVACVALDLRRIQQNKNGCLACYQHKNHVASPVTNELNLRRKLFRVLGKYINHIVGKVSNKEVLTYS